MNKQTILLLLCVIYIGRCEKLFTKLNRIRNMTVYISWKQMSYDFDGVQYSQDAATKRTPDSIIFKEDYLEEREIFFKQYNTVPVGFEATSTKFFLTVPRIRHGIPSTLNYFAVKKRGPTTMKPYPDVDSIPSFVSVHRPKIDSCQRLWVVDTGLLDIPDNPVQMKQPEIIVFDLKTDKEILRYPLKPSDLSNGTSAGLTSITIDVTKTTCQDAYAYINDHAAGGLIVFSLRQRDSWRFSHFTFNYDSGTSFFLRNHLNDDKIGLYSIALSGPDASGVRTAYYHPFLSTQELSITTDVLKNKNGDFENNYKLLGVRGPSSQSGIHVYDGATRNLLFANIAQDGIQCWNVDKPLKPKNTPLVVFDYRWLASISDMKIKGKYLYVLSNKMDTFLHNKLNTSSTNFAVLWAKITDLINGTVCAP